jgi:hypothetical protein
MKHKTLPPESMGSTAYWAACGLSHGEALIEMCVKLASFPSMSKSNDCSICWGVRVPYSTGARGSMDHLRAPVQSGHPW